MANIDDVLEHDRKLDHIRRPHLRQAERGESLAAAIASGQEYQWVLSGQPPQVPERSFELRVLRGGSPASASSYFYIDRERGWVS